MIKKEDIDRIFEAARIEEVVGDYVTLKKRGVNLIGNCPFHNEKTPSFYVSPSKGIYKCFGCGKGGHTINFVMEHDKLTYPDALRYLAKKYNIQIVEKELTPEEQQTQNARESLFVVSSFAQKHFSENLYNTDEGKSIGLGYFKERGVREDIIEKFQLGYSINQRTAFTDIAMATGYKMEYLVKAGLTIEYKNEPDATQPSETFKPETKYLDRFWGRVMFPIHNISGKVIGFGGRTLRTDKKTSKYINSPETEIYHKSNVLYGLYFAKSAIEKEKNCLLVEGYMDVISMYQAGIQNVVASSGTSLPVEQIRLIKRFANNITILYDGDVAGIKASFRAIDIILEEGMNVKVLLFPEGDDPDSFSKRVSSEELKTFIKENTQNFIEFQAKLLTKEAGNDPIKKSDAILEIANTLSLIPSIHAVQYITLCSQLFNIEERALHNLINKKKGEKNNKKRNEEPEIIENISDENGDKLSVEDITSVLNSAEHQERDIIRLLINFGKQNVLVDTEETDESKKPIQMTVSVAELIIHELQHDNISFENVVYNTIYNEFVQQLEKSNIPDQNHFINHEDLAVASLIVDLISSPYSLSNWEKHSIYITTEEEVLIKSIYSAVNALKSRKLEIMIYDIQKKLQEKPSEEEQIQLMQTQHHLLEAKKTLNSLLGRIIVK